MRTLQTVYNKIKEEKTELATHKVELAIVDDLRILVNSLNSQISIDDRILPESQKLFSTLVSSLPKAKESVKTNKSVINSTNKKIELAEEALNKAKKAAKELGINVNEIQNYKEVDKILDEVKKSQKMVIGITKRLENLI